MTASKTSLLARAQNLARSRSALGGSLAIVSLATAATALAQSPQVVGPSPGSINFISAAQGGGSGGNSYFVSGGSSYNSPTFSLNAAPGNVNVGGVPTPVIKVSGILDYTNQFGPTYYAQGGAPLVLTLNGSLPTFETSGAYYLGFTFTPTFTAGTALVLNSITFNTSNGAFNTAGAPLVSGVPVTFEILSSDFANLSTPNFSASLNISWLGTTFNGPLQTLHLDIPNNSLDFGIRPISAVPEPATVAAGLGAAVLAGWTMVRRRKALFELR